MSKKEWTYFKTEDEKEWYNIGKIEGRLAELGLIQKEMRECGSWKGTIEYIEKRLNVLGGKQNE